MSKYVRLKGKDSEIIVIFAYDRKADLPLAEYKKNYIVDFIDL